VEDVLLEVGSAFEYEAEDGGRRHEQREQREDPVVGEHCGVASGEVPAEAVEHPDEEVDRHPPGACGDHPRVRRPGHRQSVQSIVRWPCAASAALTWLNGLLPKKPLWADRGEGCGDSITVWRDTSMSAFLRRAYPPHSTNTTCSGL